MWESNTILRYLVARQGASHLYPAAPMARAMVDQWLDWQLGALSNAFRPLYVGLVREQKPLADLASQHQTAITLFAMLDKQLARQAHIALPEFSLADIAIAPMVHRWHALQLAQPETTHLRRYYEQISADPLFAKHVLAIKMS